MSFDNSFCCRFHLSMWKCSSVYSLQLWRISSSLLPVFRLWILCPMLMCNLNCPDIYFILLCMSVISVFILFTFLLTFFWFPDFVPISSCNVGYSVPFLGIVYCLIFIMLMSSSVVQSFSLYTDFFALNAFPDVIKLLLMCSSYIFHFHFIHIPVFNVFV